MAGTPDKRRSLPRPSAPGAATTNALPLPLPFPRPLADKVTHRRTQSSAPSLASPSTDRTSHKHRRSKSWLANLFKPPPTRPVSVDPPARKLGGSLKLFSHHSHARSTTTTTTTRPHVKQAFEAGPVDEFANSEIMLTPSLPPPGVYTKPRRPLAVEEQDLATRLASWDWDGGERLSPSETTLEIKPRDLDDEIEQLDDEADQSLGTVWRGFLAETFHEGNRALSPTSTSPPLPPIPSLPMSTPSDDPDGRPRQESGDHEISFLSLAGDSSLGVSTSTSHSNLLSTFPSPSGGDISFTDPFSFANHLLPTPPRPALAPTVSPSRCNSTASHHSTLAERRSKPVPSLRINPLVRPRRQPSSLARKPSHAVSIVSESVYSRYDDDGDINEEDEVEGFAEGGGRSYFSPISPELSFSVLSTPADAAPLTRKLPPLPVEPGSFEGAAAEAGDDSMSSSSALNASVGRSDRRAHPLSSSSTSSSSFSSASPGRRHSLLFDPPAVAPPSSTFDHLEAFPPRLATPPKSTVRAVDTDRDDEGDEDENDDEDRDDHVGGATRRTRASARMSGWRQDWTFHVATAAHRGLEVEDAGEDDGDDVRGAALQSGETESEADGEEAEQEQEEEEEDISEGELDKRTSLHGQRELERRAIERKERWKAERNWLYGEPLSAEYEFGLAL
ncbi:hypothetical protein JCM11491_005545 [Sporobolomyces phaffii]